MAVVAEIIGWEFLVVVAVIALLFGGSQLPKLARGLGAAKSEFEKGLREGHAGADDDEKKANEKKADEKPAT
jgi:sec-independent protein translocase protein TatA